MDFSVRGVAILGFLETMGITPSCALNAKVLTGIDRVVRRPAMINR